VEPFVGEIKLLPWNWPPRNWHLCDGSLLPISQFTALFSLLGTQYGGNGQTTFALPDLRGRTPIHRGQVYSQGETDGAETVTLTIATMASHNHSLLGMTAAGDKHPPNNFYLAQANPNTDFCYATDTTPVALAPNSTTNIGGNQPHANMQPYLVLNYCIALSGVYPSRN